MNKTLIVYYSYEGNCRFVSKILADLLNADIVELKPKKEKQLKGFKKYFWLGKQAKMKETPELEPYSIDFSLYETILIGTPVWAWTMAPAIRTFLKENPFSGKRIALFCTHGGNPGKTFDHIEQMLPGNSFIGYCTFKEPKADALEGVHEACREWAEKIKK